ncbi:MAG: DUF488 domain-containing protein [Pseudomonadota bacterium]
MIFTIGYEKASLEDLIETLRMSGVRHLMDVRELPASRRKGFSKNALREVLERAGIQYSHAKQLGDPKAGRDAARSGNMNLFRQIFEAHMSLPETQVALAKAAEEVTTNPTALMCYERRPQDCHRTIVAERLSELSSLPIQHLGVVEDAAKRTKNAGVKEAA